MENRTCKTCDITKPITEFYKNGKFFKTNCKECDKIYSAEYKVKNIDITRIKQNEYTTKHKEKRKKYGVKYYQENRDKILNRLKPFD